MAMLSAFLVVASGSTVNIILPPMMTAFGLNLDQVQWVISAFMIAGAVLIPTVGWLGNALGNRNLFLLGLLVFVFGSAMCGLAWSGPTLIAFRVIQGLGSGPIIPMSMVFLINAFPTSQRGLAMGLFGMASAFGPAIGPVIAGYVAEYLNWRMVFYMNICQMLCHLQERVVMMKTGTCRTVDRYDKSIAIHWRPPRIRWERYPYSSGRNLMGHINELHIR